MKISALIFSAVSAQYAEEATTAAPAPVETEAPAPAPTERVETYGCFVGNPDTPCGCQWDTLVSFANKTCTVEFGDSGNNIKQFQAHGGWTEGDSAPGKYVFYGVDGMSAEWLEMNWFFEDNECWNMDMGVKEDGSYYYNRTMDPAEWKPELKCVDNNGEYPANVFSAFNSNWRSQSKYNVQVILGEGVASGTLTMNSGVVIGNATVSGGSATIEGDGNVVNANFDEDSTANSQQIEANYDSGAVPDAFACSFQAN